jgi:hypothetical protein
MAQLNYDVNQEELERSFDLLPVGEYTVIIEDSDLKPNNKNTGKNLLLTYQVIDGQLKGRKIFENLCIENLSTQAVQIAKRTLNSIGVAVGIKQIKDSNELHNKPFKIEVGIRGTEDDQYGRQNFIKKHLPLDGSKTISPQQNSTEPDDDGRPEWLRKR